MNWQMLHEDGKYMVWIDGILRKTFGNPVDGLEFVIDQAISCLDDALKHIEYLRTKSRDEAMS